MTDDVSTKELHLHLDPVGGIAGDMFCAAILDAFPEHLDGLRRTVSALGPPDGWSVDVEQCLQPICGRRFLVHLPIKPDLRHRTWGDIRNLLERADIGAGVRARAGTIFGRLAEAEADVHGSTPEEVLFHELGDWDSIIDIVAASYLIDQLHLVSASCGSLPLGGGTVQSLHGALPVPAPATLRLLRGFVWHDDGVDGERVTPTGAAIAASLVSSDRVGGELCAHGVGFGTRTLGAIPNCLRVMCFEAKPLQPLAEHLIELAFEVDDQTPEDLAQALERIRALDGVLDLHTLPVVGKAGRLSHGIRALLLPERLHNVAATCFRETATIGLRWHGVDRLALTRRALEIDVQGRQMEVKVVCRPDGDTAKVEARSLQGIEGLAERQHLRHVGQEIALSRKGSDE